MGNGVGPMGLCVATETVDGHSAIRCDLVGIDMLS